MAQYDVEIQYPPTYVSGDRTAAGELLSLVVFADWADDAETDNDFEVDAVSDDRRFSLHWDLTDASLRTVISTLDSAGEYARRHFAELNARAGVWGSYFTLRIKKLVPVTGAFKWFGARYNAAPRQALKAENMYRSGGRTNAW